jgi:hypothetical protein
VAPPARPATLTLGFVGALLAGVLSALGAILLIAKAHELAQQTVDSIVPSDSGLGDLAKAAVDDAAATLVSRGVVGLVSAILVIAIALAVRNAALWARIVLTVLLFGGLFANLIAIRDVTPGATKALDLAAIGISILVVVLLFLPPTNRYAKARRAPGR